MELKIALFRSESLVGRLIRWQTRSPYAHAALLSPAGVLLEAWHWGGVRRARLCDHPGQRVDLFRVTGLTTAQGAIAWAFAERQLGKAKQATESVLTHAVAAQMGVVCQASERGRAA